MKKNILKVTLVAAFALLTGHNIHNFFKIEDMSDLALANVEALADDNEAVITCSRSCSDGIGRCYIRSNSGHCAFTGYQDDSCSC